MKKDVNRNQRKEFYQHKCYTFLFYISASHSNRTVGPVKNFWKKNEKGKPTFNDDDEITFCWKQPPRNYSTPFLQHVSYTISHASRKYYASGGRDKTFKKNHCLKKQFSLEDLFID